MGLLVSGDFESGTNEDTVISSVAMQRGLINSFLFFYAQITLRVIIFRIAVYSLGI